MQRFMVTPSPGRKTEHIVLGPEHSGHTALLGRLAEVGPTRNVVIDVEKEHVVAVVGKRGSGKTHTLGVIVEGLAVVDNLGVLTSAHHEHGVLVFDTLNLFQWIDLPLAQAGGEAARNQSILARQWGLPEVTVNPRFWHLEGSNPASTRSTPFTVRVSSMGEQDWGLLMDVDVTADPMGQLIALALDKVSRTGWANGGRREPPIADYEIAHITRCISGDGQIAAEYAPETRRAVSQRLGAYDRTGIFSRTGTPLTDLIVPEGVSIFLLGRAPENLRTLVVFLLIRRLLDERAAASERTKDALLRGSAVAFSQVVPKTWIVIDEAQNVMPARLQSVATRELTRFVREGRNFGLSMALSTQQPSAIDPKVMAQVDILIAHTLTVRSDIDYILGNLKAAFPSSVRKGRRQLLAGESLRELEVGQCLVTAVDSDRGYFVEVRPRVTPHGGFEA